MKHIKIMIVLCMVFGFTGCTKGEQYEQEQADKIIEQGRPMLEEYVYSVSEDAQILSCDMIEGAKEGSLLYAGQYLTSLVEMEFKLGNEVYTAIVNIEDGKMYSDYYLYDLNETIFEEMKPYCEKYGFTSDYKILGAHAYTLIHCKDDVYVDLLDFIPVTTKEADSITEFSIEYVITEDEVFDPRILVEYLQQSNLHRKEASRGNMFDDYLINGQSENEEGIESRTTVIDFNGDIDSCSYTTKLRMYKNVDEFTFIYTKEVQEGIVSTMDTDPIIEYEFPVLVEDGKIEFSEYGDNQNVCMYFKEKPSYSSFTRIREEESEALVVQYSESYHRYYLTLESKKGAYTSIYHTTKNEVIEFE